MTPLSGNLVEKTDRLVRRRSREELEALAAEFVGVRGPERVNIRQVLGATAVAVVAGAIIMWLLLPEPVASPSSAPHTAASAQAELEAMAQRRAAQRERRRREMESSSAYLERIAQADRALLKEMTERARKLAAVPPPAPKAAAPSGSGAAVASAPAAPKAAPEAAAGAPPKPEAGSPKPAVASAAPAQAKAAPAPASAAQCSIRVADLSKSGTLTYEDIKNMKGARLDSANGHVFTPPVPVSGYGSVVFEVMPDGCVRVVRSSVSR